jgi:hypothetical protein
MVNPEDLARALRGKSRPEQLRVIQSVMDAGKRGRFPLGVADNRALAQFVSQVQQGRAVDDALLLAVSDIVRHYEQHRHDPQRALSARARRQTGHPKAAPL